MKENSKKNEGKSGLFLLLYSQKILTREEGTKTS
jgi:hypothetical protein